MEHLYLYILLLVSLLVIAGLSLFSLPLPAQEPATDCPHAVRANDAFEAKLTTINPTSYTSYEK